jgi:hypothetical protein
MAFSVKLKCTLCGCTNLKAYYQHVDPQNDISHQWYTQPATDSYPGGLPHPSPCPSDAIFNPNITYPAFKTVCPVCGYTRAL